MPQFGIPPLSFRTRVRGERAGRPRSRKSAFRLPECDRRRFQPILCMKASLPASGDTSSVFGGPDARGLGLEGDWGAGRHERRARRPMGGGTRLPGAGTG